MLTIAYYPVLVDLLWPHSKHLEARDKIEACCHRSVFMPKLKANNEFDTNALAELTSTLPAFDIKVGVDSSSLPVCLHRYFAAYGFDELRGFKHYSFGFIALERSKVAAHFWLQREHAPVVVIAHGLFDHVGLYLDLVQVLLDAGFNVFAMDFPGHGLSDGEPGVIRSFDQYTRALAGALEHLDKELSQPLYAVGQSTGGAVLLNYLLVERGEAFAKVVLLAPLIRPRAWASISFAYAVLSPFLRFVRRKFTVNSHREGFADFLAEHDPLQPKYISVEWIGAMKQWIKRFNKLPSSKVPVLIVQGDKDLTVDWRINLPKIQQKFSDCKIVYVPGAKHHLVKEAEAWQAQVFNETLRFLDE